MRPAIAAQRRRSAANISDRMNARCCDFSLPASRTARRSSRFSKACRPVSPIDFDAVTAELRRRQGGYGRGRRMAIESDRAEALSGVRHGVTTGAPIALLIPNKDWENWQRTMHVEAASRPDAPGVDRPAVTRPRPGHADLAGVVEVRPRRHPQRARARQRARNGRARRRRRASPASCSRRSAPRSSATSSSIGIGVDRRSAGASPSRRRSAIAADCAAALRRRRTSSSEMIAEIDRARDAGDTMGGSFEVIARGVPPGLGSYVQWDRKLDGRLAQALMSIPAIKARRHRPRPGGRRAARLAHPRRDPAAGAGAPRRSASVAADQQRRRPRRRRHQRRGSARHRLHEADRDADEAAALGRSRRR